MIDLPLFLLALGLAQGSLADLLTGRAVLRGVGQWLQAVAADVEARAADRARFLEGLLPRA